MYAKRTDIISLLYRCIFLSVKIIIKPLTLGEIYFCKLNKFLRGRQIVDILHPKDIPDFL